MTRDQLINDGRDAFRRHAWGSAYARLSEADRDAPLGPHDLECLAVSAYLLGKDEARDELQGRAHQAFLAAGDPAGAARCAFQIGFALLFAGDMAQGMGWLARARRVLDEAGVDCVERGFLLLPEAVGFVMSGAVEQALAKFAEAAAIGTRFKDRDLVVWSRMGEGRARLRGGETARGLSLLDEAMVAVTEGEVSAPTAGQLYCAVIDACYEIFDLRRAQEWTTAFAAWCATQPDLVPYRGECLVRRAEVLQLHGEWAAALEQAVQAGERLSHPKPNATTGLAFYRVGELHRVRGEFAAAESAYRRASEAGRQPEPGLALLRLAQGDSASAMAAIRRLMDETRGRNRPLVLSACVEIALATGDVAAAEAAAAELGEIAAQLATPFIDGEAAQAGGAVRLARGEPREALALLRRAEQVWRDFDAPWECARVRVLVARACQALGDSDAADLEFGAARRTFEQLGAACDLSRLDRLQRQAAPREASSSGGLSPRELEVLTQLASGATNRAIAAALRISEKTVARHVSNIFIKLGLSSRAAATAYAWQHQLIPPSQRPTT